MNIAGPKHRTPGRHLPLAALEARVAAAFAETHGGRPTALVAAPGRVNVIGEHVDYNEGLVLPAAIDRWICAAVRPRSDGKIAVNDVRLGEVVHLSAHELAPAAGRSWTNYLKGVLAGFAQRGFPVAGFEMTFASTIPMGAGLSSSAALEATVALAVSQLQNLPVPRLELALLCQEAEHNYAGVPCGLMDQVAVLLSKESHLLMLDCQTNAIAYCPWDPGQWSLMVVDSGVAHELASGEYRQRRMCCQEAARLLGVPSLRHVELANLAAVLARPELSDELRRCVRHVVTENDRTRTVVAALAEGDYARAGRALRASHESLRVDYRVSCEELDFIADTANALEGVAGCRMTGGGFGGSAIALVRERDAASVRLRIEAAFQAKYLRQPGIFVTLPVSGARFRAV